MSVLFVVFFQQLFAFDQGLLTNFSVPFLQIFKFVLKIVVNVFEKLFGPFFACEFLPLFEKKVMVGLYSAVLLSDLHETFLVLLEFFIVLEKLLIDVHFLLDVLFFFLESVFLDEVSLSFDGIVFVIQFEVLDFGSINHGCQFVFHFGVLIVGRDCMCNDWVLVLIEKSHDAHAFVFLLFLLPEVKSNLHELDLHVEKVGLFQEVFNVLILNVKIGVESDTD
jgi:hypothetical protein